jgi:hypothetical protein
MKPSQLFDAVVFAIENNLPLLIPGAPGLGKTEIVKQACKKTDTDLIIAHPVVSDPTDFKGLPFVVEGSAEFLPFGDLRKIMEAKTRTVFFLDDLGQAPPSVQAAAMQLLLAREINGKKISEHVIFMAATNRKEDKAGVVGILEPVKSRFAAIVVLEPNLDDWTVWAFKNEVPSEVISFLKFRPDLLSAFKPSSDMKNSPSPRGWEFAAKILNAKAPSDIEFELLSGCIGEGAATEFKVYLQVYRELPKFEDIIKDPKKTPV